MGTRRTAEIDWPTEEDTAWAGEFRLRLVLKHDVTDDVPDQVLAEVYEAVTESGRGAGELFGDATEYAATVAAERTSDEQRAGVDLKGVTPGDRFRGVLLGAGLLGVILAVVAWVNNGLWFEASWAGLGVTALFLGGVVLGGAAVGLHVAGRARAARTTGVCVLLVIPLATLASQLPSEGVLTLPVPAAVAAGLLLMAAGAMLPQQTLNTWFEGDDPADSDDEAWLRRLEGLLRGRHGLSAAEARQHVTEARGHLAASGGGAHGEFGPVRMYALRLADGPGRPRRALRREVWSTVLFLPLVLLAGSDTLSDPDLGSVWTWVVLAALVVWCWSAVRLWDRYRRAE